MPATPRQKACIACADSKRGCDKQLPECQRCIDRDVDCVYPQPKRRRRNPNARASQPEEVPAIQNHDPADADADANVEPVSDIPTGGLEFGDWGAGAADLDLSLSDMIMPYIPSPPAHIAGQSAQRLILEGGDDTSSSTPSPWFLGDETWVLQHSQKQPATSANIELEPFIHAVEEMLHSWVRNGYNSFIHRRLYDKGLPMCLQDAFTTLGTYIGRSPAMKETILQIAEWRSSALASQCPCTAGGAQGLRAQLARVHALFIYQFILLFDGSVHARAHAEKQQPTLRQWVAQMCEAAKRYRGEDILARSNRPRPWAVSKLDLEYETSSAMWQLWILIESVRRSQLIIDTISNIYDTLTAGWANCTGAVMFTARKGLWDADSAAKWFELSSKEEPLMVPSLQPGPLISQYNADEFDELVKVVWACIVGADKMKWWIDKSNKAIEV